MGIDGSEIKRNRIRKEKLKKLRSGNEEERIESSLSEKKIDLNKRILCGDGNCIGTIGEDGLCKICKRSLEETKNSSIHGAENVIVKSYNGRKDVATVLFRKDAANMAEQGYFPVSQSWQEGTYSCLQFLLALVLCLVIIGLIIFIYMLIVKPAGTLTVSYEYKKKKTPEQKERTGKKLCPMCAENVMKAAQVCRYCGHNFT